MNGKRFADIMICSLSVAIAVSASLYIKDNAVRQAVCVAVGIVFLIFLALAAADRDKAGRGREKGKSRAKSGRICALALLDEDDEEITEWNIAGKISLLIGRDTVRENVDINLMNTAFAGMVDRQHAVMNYTAGQWYIEDLNSANGIRIQKKDGRVYEVSGTQPCVVEKGDILYIGLTKLATK